MKRNQNFDHGIAQKVIDECPILILDIPMYFATVLLFW